jgi:HlyD family secretion protein
MNSTRTRSANVWLKRCLWLLFLVSVVTGIGAFAPAFFKSTDTAKRLTHTVTSGSLSVTITENGAVESSNNKEIKCLVKGGSTVLWVIETGTMVTPGDELVRLDQSLIEDNILKQQIVYENAQANKITAESDVAVAQISLTEYTEGTFIEDQSKVEKEIFEAEQALRKSELSLASAMRLTAKGVVKELQLEGEQFAVDSAKKDLELKRTRLDSLRKYNKEKTLQELRSKLRAAEAKLASFVASLELERTRLERERKQLSNCILKADTAGMVIFPSMAAWKDTPDIAEGAVVREQQTLLMIPDVSQMQVKVGVHESKIDRLKVGMPAKVQLQELTLEGEVSEIAEVTKPAGWWTGNLVKYDTKIKIQPHAGLKPGMSAIVDIVLAQHDNVLTIPVAAIVESKEGFFCWVQSPTGPKKRAIRLGDTNDLFSIVTDGLNEGDEVILSPLANVEEAQAIAIDPSNTNDQKSNPKSSGANKAPRL